ncbi:MAG: hypothetical protein EOO01_44465, partial [Chitinophagaceae bacterium]
AKTAGYKDILAYIGSVRKRNNKADYLICTLQALKKYYDWLVHSGARKDHPCKTLNLKDKPNKAVQLQDLFTEEELEQLQRRKGKFKDIRLRNQIIISLLIYQGLTTGDITSLKVQDIDLEAATIKVQAGTNTHARTLSLRPQQVMQLYKYIHEERSRLKAKQHQETDALILTRAGTKENGEGIKYITETSRQLFPGRKLNTRTIRMSVIELPVTLLYQIPFSFGRLFLGGGGTFGYAVSGRQTKEGIKTNLYAGSTDWRRGDLSVHLNAAFEMNNGLFVSFRSQKSVLDAYRPKDASVTDRSVSVSLGYLVQWDVLKMKQFKN